VPLASLAEAAGG